MSSAAAVRLCKLLPYRARQVISTAEIDIRLYEKPRRLILALFTRRILVEPETGWNVLMYDLSNRKRFHKSCSLVARIPWLNERQPHTVPGNIGRSITFTSCLSRTTMDVLAIQSLYISYCRIRRSVQVQVPPAELNSDWSEWRGNERVLLV